MTYPVSQFCAVNIIDLPLLLVNYGHFALGQLVIRLGSSQEEPEVVATTYLAANH